MQDYDHIYIYIMHDHTAYIDLYIPIYICAYIYMYIAFHYILLNYILYYTVFIIVYHIILYYTTLCYTMLCYIKLYNMMLYHIILYMYVRTYVWKERKQRCVCKDVYIYICIYSYIYIYIIIYSVIFLRQHFPPFPTGATFSNCSNVLRQHSQDQVPSILRCTWAISVVFFAKERTSITTLW